ncbi:universal stress protein [Cobetia sp. MC34]|uniref:universal stress protein n=1 Tax=Cobetia sp. MC34 TaxID=2785080 RepID=UPI001BC9800C|nr:universal stress protein [Cobetia sp. MC34]MBS4153326.1 universal stress protein [Cobetia sp. MC34]|tara:strand:- start:1310 stop:1786 length:477 start_codon:yes stop_codon:yes gene_type:complete
MPAVKRILCCVGLRGDCERVLARSVWLAGATGAELHVLHAVKSLSDDVMNTLKVNIRHKPTLEGLMQQRLDQAKESLEKMLEDFWSTHDNGDPRPVIAGLNVVEGYPASEIIRYATRHDCDMIIMATNKRGFVASYAGKVTKGVIKRASIPVVVVPTP